MPYLRHGFTLFRRFFKVLEFSRDEALRTGWHNIGADHIVLGILRHAENGAYYALEALGADPELFKTHIDEAVFVNEEVPWNERESVHFCESALSLLQHASLEAMRCKSEEVEPIHFLLAVCRMSGSYSHDYLDGLGISLRALVEASGLDWSHYGLGKQPAAPSESETNSLPSPSLLAAAIEKRLREGYTTDNPLVS